MTTRHLLLSLWDTGPVVPTLCIAALAAYGIRHRGRHTRRALYFVASVLVAFVALASPIGVLARGYLFSAHMLQHLLLLLVVPPLALLAMPPSKPRAGARAPMGPVGPWAAGTFAMWLWHIPTLCNAAAESGVVQGVQTASLLVLGTAFWRPVVGPSESARLNPFGGILYLFSACIACTALGILVTFSPVEVCNVFAAPVDRLGVLPLLREGWGIGPRDDQEIGGLMMWVPACFVYAGAILGMLGRYYRDEPLAARVEET